MWRVSGADKGGLEGTRPARPSPSPYTIGGAQARGGGRPNSLSAHQTSPSTFVDWLIDF